jgi:hypothetical protein
MTMGQERRRDTRRMLPFGRSAVLEVGGRQHIVSLIDLSRSGAYLGTRIQTGDHTDFLLKLLLPQSGSEMRLPCTLVRRIEAGTAEGERLPGLAVRFHDVGPDDEGRLDEFVVAGGFRSIDEIAAAPSARGA